MFRLFQIQKERYKNKNLLISIVFIVVTTIFLLFISLSNGFSLMMNEPLNNPKLKEITINPYNRDNFQSQIIPDSLEETLNLLASVNKVIVDYTYILNQDDQIYIKNNDDEIRIIEELKGFNFDFDVFSTLDEITADVSQSLIIGDYQSHDKNDILIDESIMYLLGYNPDSILNQKIELHIHNEVYLMNIIGVYDRRVGFGFFSIDDFSKATEAYKNDMYQMILHGGVIHPFVFNKDFLLQNVSSETSKNKVFVEVKDVSDVIFVHGLIEKNTQLFIHSSLGEINNYLQETEKYYQLIGLVFISIGISLIMITIMSIDLKMRNQKKFIAVLKVIGYRRKSIFAVYIYEILYQLIIVTVMYSFLSLLFSFGLESAMKNIYYNSISDKEGLFILDIRLLIQFIIYYSLIYLLFSSVSVFLSVNKIFVDEDVAKIE